MELGPHLTQCGQGEAYLLAKFHLDPSNRLATIHQRYRHAGQTDRTGQTGQRSNSITICRTVRPVLSEKRSRKLVTKHGIKDRLGRQKYQMYRSASCLLNSDIPIFSATFTATGHLTSATTRRRHVCHVIRRPEVVRKINLLIGAREAPTDTMPHAFVYGILEDTTVAFCDTLNGNDGNYRPPRS